MSWTIDRTIRVTVEDDPELVASFVHWVHATQINLIFDAVLDDRSAVFVFHRRHYIKVRDALADLSERLST